jgi:hypothetical protein
VEKVDFEVGGRKSALGGGDDDDDDATKSEELPEVDHHDLHHKNKKTKPVVGRKCAPGSGI